LVNSITGSLLVNDYRVNPLASYFLVVLVGLKGAPNGQSVSYLNNALNKGNINKLQTVNSNKGEWGTVQ
jgi:hypothetical protein